MNLIALKHLDFYCILLQSEVMNQFTLLFFPLLEFIRVVAYQNDKASVYFAFIPKIFIVEEQPKISKGKVHFDTIRRSTSVNPNTPLNLFEPHPYHRMDTHEEESEFTNSSYRMNIIGKTPKSEQRS